MPIALGDLIKRRRAELGMTQARLAELVGKSASAVRSWERGRAAPKGDATRAALAAVLGITDDELDAAIAGTDISFFSDPGRPIAADPTPTIVLPTADPVSGSDLKAVAVDPGTDAEEAADEAEEVTSEGSDVPETALATETWADAEDGEEEREREQGVGDESDADISGSGSDGDAPIGDDADNDDFELASSETVVPEPDSTDADEPEAVSGPDEPEGDPSDKAPFGSATESDSTVETELDTEPESEERELAGVGVGSGPMSLGGAVTRLVAPRQTATRPEAILAPPPIVEPDPVSQDAWLYRRRAILLGAVAIALIVVLRWALSGVGDAISEVFDNLRTGL